MIDAILLVLDILAALALGFVLGARWEYRRHQITMAALDALTADLNRHRQTRREEFDGLLRRLEGQ